jgi:levansucrase
MKTHAYHTIGATILVLALAACNGTPSPNPNPNPGDGGTTYGPRDNFTDRYTLQEAISQKANEKTTLPVIQQWQKEENKTLPGYHVWDTWPVRRLTGEVAVFEGWSILIHLSVPESVLPGKRHDIAQLRWSYSKDGKNWTLGGLVFEGQQSGVVPGVVLGSRNWAGSAVVGRDGQIYIFYTASGKEGEEVRPGRTQTGVTPQSGCPYDNCTAGISYEQRIAVAWGPKLKLERDRVSFEGTWQHKIILEADGKYYQTQEQADVGPLNAFRDPWVFEDPNDGKIYMLLEGNVGGAQKSAQTCAPEDLGDAAFRATLPATPKEAAWYNGNVGLAASVGDNLTNWELLPPLLQANCVNQELERPHFIFRDGKYYLFFATHITKAAPFPGLRFYEGLYGFSSPMLRGDYKPLNGSGLVLNTPDENPYQQYSFEALNTLPNPYVTSFVDYAGLGTTPLAEIGGFSPQKQLELFGGTLAPTIEMVIEDDRTRISNVWENGKVRPYSAPVLPRDQFFQQGSATIHR